jgi:NAD(P)-dependent dehydrogenase (short-subunit alcohol dehydrogenase family)
VTRGTDLSGRTAIVTGGSRGIGLAIASALSRAGANVVVTARTEESAAAGAAELGAAAAGFAAHAADADAAAACVAFARERFGPVGILVNNAGTNAAFGRLVDVEHDRFAKTLDVNTWAPLLWTQQCWYQGMRLHGGVVINNASIGAHTVGRSLGVYHASKAMLVHLTRHLAAELAPRVRVNAVAPGIVRTRLSAAIRGEREDEIVARTPLGRLGAVADVGSAVAFLASDAADWITGETLTIDGGLSLVGSLTDLAEPRREGDRI